MDEKGDGDSVEDIVAGRATDYVTTLSTDAASLSDSDPEDPVFPLDAEVDTHFPAEEVDKTLLLDGIKPPSLFTSRQVNPVQPFHLKGMSSTFSVRSQSIFDSLEGATNRAVTCPVIVPEWNFKRPLPPGPLIRSIGEASPQQRRLASSVPDYVAHPERWTKYSLEEVAELSDKTNTMVAENFLEDMKRRKMAEKVPNTLNDFIPAFNQDTSSSGLGRILFSKPSKSELQRKGKEDGQKEQKNVKSVLGMDGSKIAAEWGVEEEAAQGEEVENVDHAELKKEEEPGLEETDAAHVLDKGSSQELGFHSNKKRIRKNIRARVHNADAEDEDTA
ncbi:U5 small nuclear ribonucleoprotein TSSC4 [Ambystoma mexicanum]|uniref:U5 small nuclear ribonucleoprotein TSSC4 n=1 Tax=Ambystoma mexicanum TaxID=8296 RepID=UPI0037E723A0